MDRTPNLDLPFIMPAQAQKHVTHNEALLGLDALVHLAVLDRDLTDPPATPDEGDRHIVATGGADEWTGWDGSIAAFADGAWRRHAPQPGWLAWIADEAAFAFFDGAAWTDLGTALSVLQNLSRLGIATSADATNPLSARLNGALLAAVAVADGGDGDIRLKLSKETAADTASCLFQTGFSGRAEIGLAGDDNLTMKVSADGAAWMDALEIDRTNAAVSFPATPVARKDQANTWLAENAFSAASGGTLLNVSNPASIGSGTELRVIQNFNGGACGLWNSMKGRNTAGVLSNPSVNDEIGRFEMRAFATTTYKTAGRFRATVGTMNVTGGGDTPSAYWQWLSRGAADTGAFDCNLETMRITHVGAVHFPQVGTTGSAANAFIDNGASPANQLLRSTSSARFKTDIEPLDSAIADRVLREAQPIWYRSKAGNDRLPDGTAMSFYGLTAEAMAQIDPRLVSWTWRPEDIEAVETVDDVPDTDENGATIIRQERRVEHRPVPGAARIPDGVMYDRLAVMLLDIVRRQDARIAALENACS